MNEMIAVVDILYDEIEEKLKTENMRKIHTFWQMLLTIGFLSQLILLLFNK